MKNYALSIVLFSLFVISWLFQGVFQWQEYVKAQEEHNQPVQTEDFIPEFLSRTFENWQSEFLQLFTFVVLATYFIHKDSPQSRDGTDEIKKMLTRIEQKITKKSR